MVKELKIRYAKPNAFEIYYEGGGELPAVLQGRFTDRRNAQQAIDNYLLNKSAKGKKVVKDAET